MGQTLTNGIYLPAEGERNCYEGLAANWTALDGMIGGYNVHISNTTIHVTAEDKAAWNGKADASALTAHTGDTTIHVTAEDKQAWNGKADASALTAHTGNTTIHVTAADKQTWNGKADNSALTAHTGDTTIHVTSADKQAWDGHVADTTIHVTSADKQAWNGKADNSALTAHTGDTTIHVTSADKQAWNGKADASALTAHTGDTTIHVTAADKQTWDTVTNKANDADVMHLTGNETVGGQKTFSYIQTGVGRDLYHFASSPYSKNTPPANISFQYIWFTGNSASQGLTNNWYSGYIEHRVYPNGSAQGRWFIRDTSESGLGIELFVSGNDKQFRPQGNNITDLGATTNKWKSFNGINPGALSLPDLSNGIDISGYLDTSQSSKNYYTPSVNGWISIKGRNHSGSCGVAIIQGDMATNGYNLIDFGVSDRLAFAMLPVVANTQVEIWLKSVTILDSAKFFPCQGNV